MTSPQVSPSLTEQQRAAIHARGVSVSLSAGAGCGKTFVLTERFLSLVEPLREDALALRELVAITFTDAAAREMRDRVRQKCFARLHSAELEETPAWLQLLRGLDDARISTIHSFCGSLLRAHAVEAALDPRFGQLTPATADLLKAEVIDDLLRRRLGRGCREAVELADQFGILNLGRMLSELMPPCQNGEADAWRGRSPSELLGIWETQHRRIVVLPLVESITRHAATQELVECLTEAECRHPDYARRQHVLLSGLDRLSTGDDPGSDLDAIYEAAEFHKLRKRDNWTDSQHYEVLYAAGKSLRGLIESVCGNRRRPRFFQDAAEPSAVAGLRLLQLADEAAASYEERKRELNLLDFDDLITRAGRLLASNETLRERFLTQTRLLLVDEFQDTSPTQVALVQALCGERWQHGRLFMVGDYKQSIYRFLGAAPEVFRAVRRQTPAEGRLALTTNFRSQPEILHFVNTLFADAVEEYEPLVPHRRQVTPPPAIEMQWVLDEQRQEKGHAAIVRRNEAMQIAQRLRELVDSRRPIVGAGDAVAAAAARPAMPGDIVLLFRAMTDVEHYEAALRHFDFDCYVEGGHAFYAQQEIYDVLNLLRAIASAADEIALVGALRSPLFAVADETLFWLAQLGRTLDAASPINAALFSGRRIPSVARGEQEKLCRAAATLTTLREQKDRLPISRLLGEAIARTGYDAVLLSEFFGQRKLGNLRKLERQARDADRSGIMDLDRFITQLTRFTAQQPKEPLATTSARDAGVIRLMTIHRAKGLEFPVVVIPDVDRRERSNRDMAVLDPELGPLVRAPSEDARCVTGLDLYRGKVQQEDAAEAVRLFYVACTRAADYLMLCSGLEGLEQPRSEWTKLLWKRFDLETGMPRQTIDDQADLPRVAVTVTRVDADAEPLRRSPRPDLAKLLSEAKRQADTEPTSLPNEVEPVAMDFASRRMFSFSRLSGTLELQQPSLLDDDPEATVGAPPRWHGNEESVDGLQLGLLTHAILEHVNFAAGEDVQLLAMRHAPYVLEDAELDSSHPTIARAAQLSDSFCGTQRAIALAQSGTLHRELEFLLRWPAEAESDDGAFLHGYLDCLYRSREGSWHLLDYKTNRVDVADVANAAKVYEPQLFVYASAVQQLLGVWPDEVVVCFLQPGVEHRFEWSTADRAELTRRIRQAMQALAAPAKHGAPPLATHRQRQLFAH